MKKRLTVLIAAVLIVVVSASSAFAWRSVRTGQKNFERAWSAYILNRPDMAKQYYARAADAFGEALAENPPSRSAMFASNLTMAGMSLYHVGRYQEAVAAMDKAASKDTRNWEAYLFKGLSYAAMDNKAEAIKAFTAFVQCSSGESIISNEVSKQLVNLETDSGSLGKAAAAIGAASDEQYHANFNRQTPSSTNEECNGTYWWRYNREPCTHKLYISN